jgi:AcrR family transcriptional regulator
MPKKYQQNQRRIPKQSRALEKYNRVLDACSRLLAEQNYDRITMSEISLESELPFATIYQYFGNKEDIMLAWMARLFDDISELISQRKKAAERSTLQDQIQQLIRTSLWVMSENHSSMRALVHGMPRLLSSKLLLVIEERTVNLVKQLYGDSIFEVSGSSPESERVQYLKIEEELDYQLSILTRLLVGFLMNNLLSGNNRIDVERDSAALAKVVNAYLNAGETFD